MKVKNATQKPRIYYGLHMVEGVAEYPEHKSSDGRPLRILVLENALKEMNPTFAGCPVYVRHVDKVDLEDIQEADGFVVESFFNRADGKHWAKFIITSDAAHEAIRSGWKLSNAYTIKDFKGGGEWHAVPYSKEVARAEYGHLAIVPNPRYEESEILTPEEFKAYNSQKETELRALQNAKEISPMKSMFNWFNKKAAENGVEIESAVVTLSDGSERTVKDLVNAAEAAIKKSDDDKGDEPLMANMEHKVKCGDEMISVNDLTARYNALKAEKDEMEKNKKNAEDEEKKNADAKKADEEKQNAKTAEEKAAAEKAAIDEAARKKAEDEKHFTDLKNAADLKNPSVLETSADRAARGKSRYGSGK